MINTTDISGRPDIIGPNGELLDYKTSISFRDKIEDAEQEGYITGYEDGYNDATNSRPLRVCILLTIGLLTGLLISFFTYLAG